MLHRSRYACALAVSILVCGTALASSGGRLALRSLEVSTVPGQIDRAASSPDDSLLLIQFPGPIDAATRQQLEDSVERVLTYLPHHTYLVRTCRGSCSETARRADATNWTSLGAHWVGPYRAEYKISPEIARSSAASTQLRPVLLHLFPDVSWSAAREELIQLLGRPPVAERRDGRFARLRFLLNDAEIAALRPALAARPEVFWIEREARRVLLNDSTVWVGQSGLAGGQATPVHDAGLRGEGQIVAVLDTGLDADSCYFYDSTHGLPPTNCSGATTVDTNQRKVLAVDFLWSNDCNGGISATEWDNQGHGTHVAGTVAGDDTTNEPPGVYDNHDGMAPAAKLIIQDGGYASGDNCADLPGLGCPVIDLVPIFQQTYDQGARIHTNSWGDEENDPNYGEYTAGSEDADQFMWDNPDFLLLFAAGNNGGTTNTVDSPSTAKSPISVGSTLRATSAGTISGFSSRGPTDDGRIKPDLTNPGSGIGSAANNGSVASPSCSEVNNSGTSMATPGAAGFAALARQYYMDGFYPSGSATPGDAFAPSAALVKATLINSATQMANEGTIPNDTQGWGRVQLDTALAFAGGSRHLWVEDDPVGFPQGALGGDAEEYFVIVDDSLEPLEVTLAWTDYPSTPIATDNLVNDLDLTVIGPDGTFRGNVFSGGVSTTGGSPDRTNTVENVLIAAPSMGLWTIRVEPFTVPSGASQPFAVVASGGLTSCEGTGRALVAANSGVLTIQAGDGDDSLDNCEPARIDFTVLNAGETAATNATVVSVSSPSHPGTLFAAPSWSSPSIAGCGSAAGFVDILAPSGLQPGDTFEVEIEVTNDETAPDTETTTLRFANTERDLTGPTTLLYDFESDLSGWQVDSGTFARTDALGGADGSSYYLQSSAAQPNQCDVVVSPAVGLTATSTLTLWNHYEIEDGPTWYDRANLSLIENGVAEVVEPSGGRLYDVEAGTGNGPCGTNLEAGWAGTQDSWATSSFDAAALDSANRNDPVQLQIEYATDGGVHPAGFRFDQIEWTDVLIEGPDQQPDLCSAFAIFADGFETGDTSRWN